MSHTRDTERNKLINLIIFDPTVNDQWLFLQSYWFFSEISCLPGSEFRFYIFPYVVFFHEPKPNILVYAFIRYKITINM